MSVHVVSRAAGFDLVATLALALVASIPAYADEPAPPVSVQATIAPATATIGTRVRYELTVSAPAGLSIVVAQPAEKIGDLDIVDFGTDEPVKTADGRVVFHRWWQVVAWTAGPHVVASPRVQYRGPGDELADVPGQDVTLTVESLLTRTPDATDVRELKPPEAIPIDWRPYWWIGGTLAALALLAFAVHRLLARRRRAPAAAPRLAPDVVARAALEALRARRLAERGAFKDLYSALSDIVRRYLEDRFQVRAPEMTTEEFLAATARDGRLAPPHRRLLGEFLVESDLVKFARHVPTVADSERAFHAARRFVDETSVREAA